ncbi:MFS transporter [Yinghuangia soli]|uniref:MFS transporter n=1 Tax=Yinghuangia soli TaxID=2908204 RepID=A0AA41PXU7_9ACTN|nr:MFS transporter [Yinghuangia soli]MCF2527360.1 MFS transporter [Yinghuangia soli]
MPSAWRRMRMWGVVHAVDDLYQGLVPATVPYFVLDRGYSYVAATGLTLAATLGSSLPQPFLGVLVDRYRAGWMAAAGVAAAGLGLGLSGLVDSYAAVWLLLLLSGLGVAMFHPAAGKAAREEAGESTAAMSIFAAGGSVGFFLAPVLATPALVAWGVGSTALFIPPALLAAYVLHRNRHRQRVLAAAAAGARTGTDQWTPFLVLTGVSVVRSVVFFGVATFIELYWIRHLGASHVLGGAALACFLAGGVAGTLVGGRIADRIGLVRTVQLGGALVIPMLVGLRAVPGPYVPLVFAVLTGVALNIPFAVLVKLGQDYLPTRPGTAAGVTLGLAVSIGGLIGPVFGFAADARGPQSVFSILCFVPLLALALGAFLREPHAAAADVDTGTDTEAGAAG